MIDSISVLFICKFISQHVSMCGLLIQSAADLWSDEPNIIFCLEVFFVFVFFIEYEKVQ